MLINFDQASVETSHLTDMKSFGDLLKGMIRQCTDEDNWQVNQLLEKLRPFFCATEKIDFCWLPNSHGETRLYF